MQSDAQHPAGRETSALSTIGGHLNVNQETTFNHIDITEPYPHYELEAFTLDEQVYDFGTAADYNDILFKEMNIEIDALTSTNHPSMSVWSTQYATTSIPEAAIHIPAGITTGLDIRVPNTVLPLECNLEVSMSNITGNNCTCSHKEEKCVPSLLFGPMEASGHPITTPQRVSGPLTARGSADTSRRAARGRLTCPHPRCNKTFPRQYEQVSSPHFMAVVCSAYGCHRTTKPFKRADKFMEHFRKHGNSQSYRCLMETCQSGSFDIPTLTDHLVMQHYMDYDTQQNFDWIMKTVLRTNSIPFWFGRVCSTGGDLCPLASIGCTYRISADVGERRHEFVMRAHAITHKHSDLVEGKDLLREFFAGKLQWYLDEGVKDCMLCLFQVRGFHHRNIFFTHLMGNHSKEERSSVLKDIFRIVEIYHKNFCYLQRQGEVPSAVALANECRAIGLSFRLLADNFFDVPDRLESTQHIVLTRLLYA
ncbi:hypothetical protein SBOR_9175 [Sclerotinia borealis F-4128]|uniref:C2H2-type domain-containing protein n=1 Tax=Sclerotinia borealis (strain F-4128) TaxID=1432307 RepID=W9C0V5_SCLBF|nr:hypothetical protein SBOR_9175 [Sclerotinia borealis F-4128]